MAGDRIHGALNGETCGGAVKISFEIAEASQQITLSGKGQPLTEILLVPTLGWSIREALWGQGMTLTIGSALATGTEGDNWKLEGKTALDLAKLPADLGLGGATGTMRAEIEAFGPLGGRGTLHAKLTAPEGGAIPAAALRNLVFLFDATLAPVDESKPVAYESLDLNIIVTREQVFLAGPGAGRPAALYAPGGAPVMIIPTREIRLDEFLRRLDVLRERWYAAHAS